MSCNEILFITLRRGGFEDEKSGADLYTVFIAAPETERNPLERTKKILGANRGAGLTHYTASLRTRPFLFEYTVCFEACEINGFVNELYIFPRLLEDGKKVGGEKWGNGEGNKEDWEKLK